MFNDRLASYKSIEEARSSKLLVYVTGDRPGMETQISPEVFDYFGDHLDLMGHSNEKISLLLYTIGGNTLAGWSIVNLIRQFCDEFEVIVPAKALSTGTIICLGANNIVMTKQATLGPIDPSIHDPLNPKIEGLQPPNNYVPVSVEAVMGFVRFAKDELKLEDEQSLVQILNELSSKLHPLVLGAVHRSKTQIQAIAGKLLSQQISDQETKDKIISFLVTDSGSHDYTISRREARNVLGLKVETPDEALYRIIKSVYNDIRVQLQLNTRFDPNQMVGINQQSDYKLARGLVESVAGGSHVFYSEGVLTKNQAQVAPGVMQTFVSDQRTFEGWQHEHTSP